MNKNRWPHIFEKKKIYTKNININSLKKFKFEKISYYLTNQVYSKMSIYD